MGTFTFTRAAARPRAARHPRFGVVARQVSGHDTQPTARATARVKAGIIHSIAGSQLPAILVHHGGKAFPGRHGAVLDRLPGAGPALLPAGGVGQAEGRQQAGSEPPAPLSLRREPPRRDAPTAALLPSPAGGNGLPLPCVCPRARQPCRSAACLQRRGRSPEARRLLRARALAQAGSGPALGRAGPCCVPVLGNSSLPPASERSACSEPLSGALLCS